MQWQAGVCCGSVVLECGRYCVNLRAFGVDAHKHFDFTPGDSNKRNEAQQEASEWWITQNMKHKLSSNDWRYTDESRDFIEVALNKKRTILTRVDATIYERLIKGKGVQLFKTEVVLNWNHVPLRQLICPGTAEIVNKDGDKLNNTLDNLIGKLEWLEMKAKAKGKGKGKGNKRKRD